MSRLQNEEEEEEGGKEGQLIMEAGPTNRPTPALTPGSRNIKGGKQKKKGGKHHTLLCTKINGVPRQWNR